MSKKLKNLKWESVALEGFPVSLQDNFQGFVGLEECTNYGLDKENKKSKKLQKKQKRKTPSENTEVPQKKVKLTNGFVVESCNTITPSANNEEIKEIPKKKKKNKNRKKKSKSKENKTEEPETKVIKENPVKKNKLKLGENVEVNADLTPEDMLTWAEFKLPETIVKGLMELGFKQPTKIQQLTLPAAIHGRRDILGAAETGSGKTLAFGLPIISGIIKLKEKAIEKGLDVYDIPYKKSSAKKKVKEEPKKDKKKRNKKDIKSKAKESSEEGYSSGDDESEDKNSDDDEKIDNKPKKQVKIKPKKQTKEEEDYIEEIVVPIKKRDPSADEGNDSDDSANYIHLSEMLDSDDLAEKSSDEENDDTKDDDESDEEGGDDESDEEGDDDDEDEDDDGSENEVENDEVSENDDDDSENEVVNDDDSESEAEKDDDDSEDEEMNDEEIDENESGIGCVKVIDNIEIPGHVVTKTGKPLYALILTPTRELAIQISRHLIAAAKYTGVRIATIVGGMAAVKQERVLRCGPEIVVATPGRLWELINQGQTHLQQLDSVKFLAIDETDRMIERGHFEELTPLLERLNVDEAKRSARQNFVFSATLTMVHDLPAHMKGKKVTKRGKIINRKIEKMTPQQKIKRLIGMIGMTDPKVVDITTQNLGTAETLTECRIACSLEHKDAYLYYILKRHPGRTIVFCNSIGSVKRLAQLFTLLKCHPLPLHANLQQRQRLKNLERFRDDPHGVLVATDVAARGLDIPNVDHVIHYQVPRTAENYVHRSGRTARANKEGLTILMMEPSEAYLYAKLCRTLNKTSEVPTFPVAPQSLSPIKDIMSLARDMDALMLRRRRATQAQGWREKVAREMDIIVDEDDIPITKVDPSIEKALNAKKKQLDSLLSRPMFPKGFSFKYPTLNDPNALSVTDENALQIMKKAIETGELKKEKRKSKNAPLLKLQKSLKKKK